MKALKKRALKVGKAHEVPIEVKRKIIDTYIKKEDTSNAKNA